MAIGCSVAWREGTEIVLIYGGGPRRDAATLLPIIVTYVRAGTIVYSDKWATYSQLSATARAVHWTVNHSQEKNASNHFMIFK